VSASLALIGLALGLGVIGPRWLSRASWPTRAPGLGILAWQALSMSVFLSLVLAGLTLAVPELPASEGVAEFFHACTAALKEHYATPSGVVLALLGLALSFGLLTRLGFLLSRGGIASRRDRERQHDLLRLVSTSHPEPDVVVIDHPTPAVYCLPGRSKQVVVTAGALAALSAGQLRGVLAHERAHIRARHDLALLAAECFAALFCNRLGSGVARERIADLAEMHADDAADRSARRDLATAVLVLAGGTQPAAALAASGGCALTRVRRLALPPTPVSLHQQISLVALVAVALALPVVIALAPALSANLLDYCPVFS